MPAIQRGDLVLVTGASGFIAAHIARELLQAGLKVRGTVRSDTKGQYLVNLFKPFDGQFEYHVVPDMVEDGAYDKAVRGVDTVVHAASPFHFQVSHPSDLIDPAVKGTTNVLKSLSRNAPGAQRVVMLSSTAAVQQIYSVTPPHTYHDDDWNTDAPQMVEQAQGQTPGIIAYIASKALAERAFWSYLKEEQTAFDGVALNPGQVMGEIIHECNDPKSLNTSLQGLYPYLMGQVSEEDLRQKTDAINWVNVKDLAKAHVAALLSPEASGSRFILSAGVFVDQDYCDVLHKHYSDLPGVPVGRPGCQESLCEDAVLCNSDKAKRVLGVEFTSFEDTIVEATKSIRARFQI